MNIEFQIPAIDTYDHPDLGEVARTVHFRIIGAVEGSPHRPVIGDCLDLPEPDPDNFIKFEALTKEDVQAWVSDLYVKNLHNDIMKELDSAHKKMELNFQKDQRGTFTRIKSDWSK